MGVDTNNVAAQAIKMKPAGNWSVVGFVDPAMAEVVMRPACGFIPDIDRWPLGVLGATEPIPAARSRIDFPHFGRTYPTAMTSDVPSRMSSRQEFSAVISFGDRRLLCTSTHAQARRVRRINV